MEISNQLFFELLQVALGTRSGFSQIPTVMQWNAIMQEAQKQALLGVIIDGMEKLPPSQLPPKEMLLQWIGLAQIMERTYIIHCERARELTESFSTAGFKSCVLKGIGMAQSYPKPERRQCGDIDLWVSGSRMEVMRWMRSNYRVGTVVWHHVDVDIFDNVETEIHFHPIWLYNPWHNRYLQQWFKEQEENTMMMSSNGYAYPSASFNAIYSLIHTFHHLIEEGVGLRHIVDYYYVMTRLRDRRNESLNNIKRLGLFGFAGAMMWVLKEVCGMSSELLLCEPNEREGKFLLKDIMEAGNFGKYRKNNLKRNSASRMLTMLLHFPNEVIWVVPWKLWHKYWRLTHRE